MRSRIGWLAGVLAVVAIVLVLLRSGARRDGREPTSEREVEEARAPALLAIPAVASSADGAADAGRTAVASETAPQPSAGEPAVAEVCGRFLLDDGSPAAGVVCALEGWNGNDERVRRFGVPEDWRDLSVTTGADGRFSFRLEPPRAFQFSLDAKAPGFAGVSWRWSELEPEKRVDVGDVTLVAGGTLEGRIVDGGGNPLRDGEWWVTARSVGLDEAEGREESQVMERVDREGSFRLVDVMPGSVELSADSDVAGILRHPPLTLAPRETLTVDLVYGGPLPSRRITVDCRYKPFWFMPGPAPEHVRLIAPNGDVRTATGGPGTPLVFDELAPGAYAIEIDDPRFLPWSEQGVAPGKEVVARLEGSAGLTLDVRDEEGAVVGEYSARLELRSLRSSDPEVDVEPVAGALRGVIPGDYTLRIAAGERMGTAVIDALAPSETRALLVTVSRSGAVRGRVVYSDGTPVPSASVLLLEPARVGDSATSPILTRTMGLAGDDSRYRREVGAEVTAADGSFRLALPEPGRYAVRASGDQLAVSSAVFDSEGVAEQELELVLPRGGSVRGTVRGKNGESCAGLRVAFEPELHEDDDLFTKQQAWNATQGSLTTIAPDGSFALGPVAAGVGTLFLYLPPQASLLGGQTIFSTSAPRVPLARVTIEEGVVLERDFVADGPPGTIVVEVTVDGKPAPRVALHSDGFDGTTGSAGSFGPAPVFAGAWTISASSREGWTFSSPLVEVVSGEETRVRIDVPAVRRALLFVDARSGAALAKRKISVFQDNGRSLQRRVFRPTDAEGRATFELTAGEYWFALDAERSWELDTSSDVRRAQVTWTSDGPLVERVEL